MKRLLFIMLALICLPAMAEQRSVTDAQNVAMSHLRSVTARRAPGVNQSAPQLTLAKTAMSVDNKVDYYVFNEEKDQGFVIVSGDDKAAPVLGYCDEGEFDENDIPDGLRYMLECYAEQMRYLRSHPASAYSSSGKEFPLSVSPLLTTRWNQNAPYNNNCPTFGTNSERAAVGCVATATAQVMNYHKWPKQGTGEFTYVCNVNNQGEQTLSADFGSTTYEWDKMLDDYANESYTAEQADAIATLMYHVGVAEHMRYGATSSTSNYAAMEALRTYFGYNNGMKFYSRHTVPAAQWDSLLLNELRNARPILYDGATPTGGHSFVLDGCNAEGYYHFNWGWGGKSNGYFLITALNPRDQGIGSFEGGYNASQSFIANLYPDRGEPDPERYLEANCTGIWPDVEKVNVGEKIPINVKHLQFNGYGYGLSTDIILAFQLTDENNKQIYAPSSSGRIQTFEFGSRYNFTNQYILQYTSLKSLADGNYKLWLVYKPNNSAITTYSYLKNMPCIPGYINLKVENGVVYASSAVSDGYKLSVKDLIAPSVMAPGATVDVTASITNAGDEYYNNIYLSLEKDGESVKIYDPVNINLGNGDKITFKTAFKAPDEIGDYQLLVLDCNLNTIAGGILTLSVVENSNYNLAIATPLKVADYYMDMDNISATAVISNSGTGDYNGPIGFMILTDDEKTVITSGTTPIVNIPAGGSTQVNINTYYEGIPGVVYKLCLRNLKYPNNYTMWGDGVSFELNSFWPTTPLGKLLNDGFEGGDYMIADNLAVMESHDESLFATNGYGSWIEVKCGDYYNDLVDINDFKAGTVRGTYALNNGNPSITLTKLPEAGKVQDIYLEKLDLSQPFTLEANQVVDFSGYYFTTDGQPMIYAKDGSDGDYGVAVPISFDWLSNVSPVEEGAFYDLHGVVRLLPETGSGSPARKVAETTENYVVYLTKDLVYTGISGIGTDAVKINVAGGTISVTGTKRVAVYNMTGALVSTSSDVSLPAGVYVVIADGLKRKVVVR